MWILLIVFLLLSDRIGWCIWVFLVVAGAMLLALAVKLAWIVRYTSRARVPDDVSGSPHDLDPSAFFFRRPWLMLPPIKLLLFFVSLVRKGGEAVGVGREREAFFMFSPRAAAAAVDNVFFFLFTSRKHSPSPPAHNKNRSGATRCSSRRASASVPASSRGGVR